MSDPDPLVAEFLAESRQNLDRLERDVRRLERTPGDRQLLAGVFRTVHTLKGSCGFLGYGRLEAVTHVSESLLSRLRDGDLSATPEVAAALLGLATAIRGQLARIEATGRDGAGVTQWINRMDRLAHLPPAPARPPEPDDLVPLVLAVDSPPPRMTDRLVPIGTVWDRLPRLVRDLAAQCGKQVRLEASGRETEFDQAVIEAIRDPLTHLVRNAVGHGIEPPAVRAAVGKPIEGCIFLRAAKEWGWATVELADDGGGIDLGRVRAVAVARGLIAVDRAARLADRELAQLVFLPGLSTAPAVTRVSGRGVGMDVVRANVERLGGTVELATRPGEGTAVRIRVPVR